MKVFCAGKGFGAGAVGAAELLYERGSGGRGRGGEIICHWEDAAVGFAMEMGIMVEEWWFWSEVWKGGIRSIRCQFCRYRYLQGADAGYELPESGILRICSSTERWGIFLSGFTLSTTLYVLITYQTQFYR